MKDAPLYPVTQGYGYDPTYPINGGNHLGIDYGFPMGTPVIVNGVQIGLSNNTGATTGPHLHVGKFVNGVVQNPGIGNGFRFDSAVVFDTGYDATNGNYVRITGDGALWNYLHLETVSVTKGQALKGEPDMTKKLTSTDQVRQLYVSFGIEIAGDNPVLQKWVDDGGTDYDLMLGLAAQVKITLKVQADTIAQLHNSAPNATQLNPGLYKV